MAPLSRRQFLSGAATLAAVGALGACSSSSSSSAGGSGKKLAGVGGVTDPSKAPFDTVVVLMMENRSFDHLLGWVPGANGKQAGLTFPDLQDHPAATYPLGSMTQACDLKDPSHDWQSVARQFNDGRCDGWLKTQTTGDHFPIGYYEHAQVPILGALAQNYTLFDSYHCSLLGPTWPNRFYMLCAATDVDATGLFPGPGQPRPSNLQLAIFDRVQEAGLSTGYYTWGEPMTELFTSHRYDRITYPKDKFFEDAKAGKLPNVTFIDPNYTTVAEFLGISNDDHPHGNIEDGEGFLAQVLDAVTSSPQWERTILVINFDEHGGFYDHVVPPVVVDDNVTRTRGRIRTTSGWAFGYRPSPSVRSRRRRSSQRDRTSTARSCG